MCTVIVPVLQVRIWRCRSSGRLSNCLRTHSTRGNIWLQVCLLLIFYLLIHRPFSGVSLGLRGTSLCLMWIAPCGWSILDNATWLSNYDECHPNQNSPTASLCSWAQLTPSQPCEGMFYECCQQWSKDGSWQMWCHPPLSRNHQVLSPRCWHLCHPNPQTRSETWPRHHCHHYVGAWNID